MWEDAEHSSITLEHVMSNFQSNFKIMSLLLITNGLEVTLIIKTVLSSSTAGDIKKTLQVEEELGYTECMSFLVVKIFFFILNSNR